MDSAEHDHVHHSLPYAARIALRREDEDEAMRTDPASPLPEADRASFAGVPYFDVDESWRLSGLALDPYTGDGPEQFEMETTDGRRRSAARAGEFRFARDGVEYRLTAYRTADRSGLLTEDVFVPFLDATTGTETYGAGRYLDPEPDSDGTWTLDFNLAYHPSCVWNPRYSCPITPAENRLPMRVEAGERLGTGGN